MIIDTECHYIKGLASPYPLSEDVGTIYHLEMAQHGSGRVGLQITSTELESAAAFSGSDYSKIADTILCIILTSARKESRTYDVKQAITIEQFLTCSSNSARTLTGHYSKRSAANNLVMSKNLAKSFAQLELYNGVTIYVCDQMPDNQFLACYKSDNQVIDSGIKLAETPDGMYHACFMPGWENYYLLMTLDYEGDLRLE
jgi:hypothetical protein